MISIIICSINPCFLIELKENIEKTIKSPYEILEYDNRVFGKNICDVYNLQASKAKYDILCFLHEDVVFHTIGWGKCLVELLKIDTIGLVGISGSVYKSKFPATWSACHNSFYRSHSIQHFNNQDKPVVTNINPNNDVYSEVAAIDGVFMATRKDIFNKFKFDSSYLKGFHGYDIDYSLQVGQHYQVVVSYEILLEHLSEGVLSNEWLKYSLQLHRIWKKRLPLQINNLPHKVKRQSDYLSCSCVLLVGLRNPGNKKLVLYYYLKLVTNFLSLNKFRFSKSVFIYLFNFKK